jgi:serine/threonine-protein kinase ULK4
LTLLLFK